VKKVLIGGIGNVLLGDDGVGPYLARLLDACFEFEDEVEVIDLGTPALDLIDQISGKDVVILIDSVDTGEVPGTVILYRKEEIMRQRPAVRMDPHSPALVDALLSAELFGVASANILLFGIAAETFEPSCCLSKAVNASLDRAILQVLKELDHFGIKYHLREHPKESGAWWTGDKVESLPATSAFLRLLT
jgi:hydrogenase maturation protease